MSRSYPLPRADKTLHVLSDLHCHPGFVYERRRPFVTEDMARADVPTVQHHLTTGDFANTATTDQYAAGIAFMETLGGEWYSVVGNHDMWEPGDSTGTHPHRSAAAAAADLGMPTSSFAVDLGYAVLLIPHPTSSALTYDANWINTQAQAHSGRHIVIAAHGSLKNTAGTGDSTSLEWRTSDTGWHASGVGFDVTTDLDTCLADNANIKAWIGGHTHSSLGASKLVSAETYGSHTIAAINAMAISYTGKTAEWWDRIASLFVTFEPDRIEVRFRDHGAHAWVGGSKENKRCWTVTL